MATVSAHIIAALKAPSLVVRKSPKLATSRRITCNSVAERDPGDATDPGKRKFISTMILMGAMAPAIASSFWNSAWAAPAGDLAQDEYGKNIVASVWIKSHPPGDHTAVRGSPDGPTYLVMETNGSLASYGVNAICTHMGCVVPWNPDENKFMCPCHGSQYDFQGKVIQGPAPLSLPLAHVDVVNEMVVFSPWLDTDFRTGEAPWWAED